MVPSAGSIRGHVDTYHKDSINGWAFDMDDPGRHVPVEVLHNGEVLCTVNADRFREDLQNAGHGDGRHAFEITLPMAIFAEPVITFHIRVAGEDLLGSPLTVHNHQVQLGEPVLAALAQTIAIAAATAETSETLDVLAHWLIAQFDTVYQRQSLLARSQDDRDARFEALISKNTTLSELLRDAAAATVRRYPVLEFPVHATPLVTVIIAAFNHFDVTYRCLESIMRTLPTASFEVILVDDASTDETIYAGLVTLGGLRIIRNARNRGFLHSVMSAAAVARGTLLMLLNNDCLVHEGWLDHLAETLKRNPDIGIAGSKLLFPDGRLQEAGGIIWRQGSGHNYGRGADPADPRYCFMRDVDYVSGAGLMVSRTLFESVGGFSEAFAPGYYEDTDLCFKVRAAGFRVVMHPHSMLTHYEGVSSGTAIDGPGMKRFQRINQRTFLRTWFDTLQGHPLSQDMDPHQASEWGAGRRLLFIDDTVPTPDRDAGSNAAISHMLSLQRLGFKVSFVGAHNMARIPPYTDALEGAGIEVHYAPYCRSVEEVLRRAPVAFDVIYVNRIGNMTKYAAMIRQHFPDAVLIYNMADIHHLRLEREAEIKQDATIRFQASTLKAAELAMIEVADSVIVHSAAEAEILKLAVPNANVHVVAWTVAPVPTAIAFDQRQGLAFVGGYNHTPNVDAALWLVNDVMPLVWARMPDLICNLIGANMPASIQALAQPLVRVLGHVADLGSVLSQLKLTVAPLRYGAGLKGKVLTSLAHGIPCIVTPCAAEGMEVGVFGTAIASTPEAFADQIVAVYSDEAVSLALQTAGLDFIRANYSTAMIDSQLKHAIQRRQALTMRLVPETIPDRLRA